MTIIAQIQGGLGNQLFQYAAGRALAVKLRERLVLDRQWFERPQAGTTQRAFLLDQMNVKGEIQVLNPLKLNFGRFDKLLQTLLPINPYIYKEKNEFSFQPHFGKGRLYPDQDLYLMGYWQSFRYFEKIRPLILEETSFRFKLSPHYQSYLNQIMYATLPVMVHIRRGDYVNVNSVNRIHGLLSLDYYKQAMLKLVRSQKNIQFFIFSDDIEWVKANLPTCGDAVFVENIDEYNSAAQELQLMRACHNFIIANSSLSWWGAWLGVHPKKQVIAPSQWLASDLWSSEDLFPHSWVRL